MNFSILHNNNNSSNNNMNNMEMTVTDRIIMTTTIMAGNGNMKIIRIKNNSKIQDLIY